MLIVSFTVILCGFNSAQQMLEEQEQQLQAQQQRCDAAEEHLDWLLKTFSTVRAGVEHLADKLQHITLVNTTSTIMTIFFSPFPLKIPANNQADVSSSLLCFSPE